jgi:hypothetical protein
MPVFHVGFFGNGEVTQQNATELLDTQLLPAEPDTEFAIYLPDSIRRTQKGLNAVRTALNVFELEYEQVSAEDMITVLAGKDPAYLVVLWDGEDEATAALVEKAITAGIKVKDLCAALDDVELADEEAPKPPTRGKPRATAGQAVEAKVEGPAVIASAADRTAAQLMESAIRGMIHEEFAKMGLSLGHNAFAQVPEEEQKVRAFVDSDGAYEKAPDSTRKAPRGKRTVLLTADEAAQAGLS